MDDVGTHSRRLGKPVPGPVDDDDQHHAFGRDERINRKRGFGYETDPEVLEKRIHHASGVLTRALTRMVRKMLDLAWVARWPGEG